MSLEANPSTLIPTVNLIISIIALLTTLITLFPQAPYPSLLPFLRILHILILLSPIIPSLITFSTLLTSPISTISDTTTLYPILNAVAEQYNATAGITRHALIPGQHDIQITAVVHIFIILVSVISAFIIVVYRQKVRRESSIIAFVMAIIYILACLLTAFKPGTLHLDSSLLNNTWLDAQYTQLDQLNETRLFQNFWIRLGSVDDRNIRVVWLPRVKGFGDRFCDVFNSLQLDDGLIVHDDTDTAATTSPTTSTTTSTNVSTSTTSTNTEQDKNEDQGNEEDDENTQTPTRPPPPPDEDDRPQPRNTQLPTKPITRKQLSEILIVYTIGKPLYTTLGNSISLLSLPFLTLSPIFISHAIRSRTLYPFILASVGTLLILVIYATPETLRSIRAPFQSSENINFCGTDYRIFVTDRVTHRVAVFHVVSFAFVGLTAIIQGFRWLRREKNDDMEVKMIGYDDVFSRSGSLRW